MPISVSSRLPNGYTLLAHAVLCTAMQDLCNKHAPYDHKHTAETFIDSPEIDIWTEIIGMDVDDLRAMVRDNPRRLKTLCRKWHDKLIRVTGQNALKDNPI